MEGPFRDRVEAGQELARRLSRYAHEPHTVILALPRGGVPVGYEVAEALHAPLDVFIVRKLGMPGHEELAMGAIATGGVRVLNRSVVESYGIPEDVIDEVATREEQVIKEREHSYRGERPFPEVVGQNVILVDDGLATGSTMRAAVQALRQQNPARIVMAVPVASAEACEELAAEVDETVCARTPIPFFAVGMWYQDFAQTSDSEVRGLLETAAERRLASRQ